MPYVVHHAGDGPPPDPADHGFVVSLGSQHSATAADPEWIPQEIATLRAAIDAGVPVLGLCFGGQALSLALGGGVDVLATPEIGWFPVDAVDEAVPPGPWLQYHFELVRVPPGARELARSPAGPAAFGYGPHLGLQFHPEADALMIERWAHIDRQLPATGLTPGFLVAESRAFAPASREPAFRLFDSWLSGAFDSERSPSGATG